MPTQEDITQQETLLHTYRQRLIQNLQQQATLGNAHVPPGISAGIKECRENIHRIKAVLRAWNVLVEDMPDDILDEIKDTSASSKPSSVFFHILGIGSNHNLVDLSKKVIFRNLSKTVTSSLGISITNEYYRDD